MTKPKKPQVLNEVCYAVGEGHIPGSPGYAHELFYFRFVGDTARYREGLIRLLPQGITMEDLPTVEPQELKVGFFNELMDAYSDRNAKGGEFLQKLSEALNARAHKYANLAKTGGETVNPYQPSSTPQTHNRDNIF